MAAPAALAAPACPAPCSEGGLSLSAAAPSSTHRPACAIAPTKSFPASAASAARRKYPAARSPSPPRSKCVASNAGSTAPACSSHSPARRCPALRSVSGIIAYAASRTSACRNTYSSSRGNAALVRRVISSAAAIRSSAPAGSPASAITPPRQNTGPNSAAARSVFFAAGPSPSSRACSIPSTLSGSDSPAPVATARISSST
ncbi:MAG: hypothetical protein R3B70_40060 [Polyangiaceae bacterium]